MMPGKFKYNQYIFFVVLIANVFVLTLLYASEQKHDSAPSPMTGDELAFSVFNRENGEDAKANMQMILMSKSGKKRTRKFTTYQKDYGSLTKQLIRFTEPADIKGTGFLLIEKQGGKTEQFLYLPALRRSRRIVSSQKSHRFVNSDFSFEDMERRQVETFEHAITGEEKISDIECFILESIPKKGTKSQYFRIKSWVAKKIYVPLKVDYFDKKGQLLKKYQVLKLKKIQNIWTETMVTMEDMKRRHKTVLKLHSISYNIGIEDSTFTRKRLES